VKIAHITDGIVLNFDRKQREEVKDQIKRGIFLAVAMAVGYY